MKKGKIIATFAVVLSISLLFGSIAVFADEISDQEYSPDSVSETVVNAPEVTEVEKSETGLKLSWKDITEAKAYKVYYKNTETENWTFISETEDTNIENLSEAYEYSVTAVDKNDQESSFSNTVITSEIPDMPAFSAVQNLENGIQISWDALENVSGYTVYRSSADESFKELESIAENSYTDINVENNTEYTYFVKAFQIADGIKYIGEYNEEGISNYFISTPEPEEITYKNGEITISWGAVTGITGYRVYKQVNDGSYEKFATLKTTSVKDSKLEVNNKYTYVIKAYKKDGTRNYWSAFKQEGLSYTMLKAPKLVKTKTAANGINISWKAVKNAEFYKIYRKTADQKKWENIGESETNNFIDETTEVNEIYYYTVVAFAGNSKSSYDKTGIIGAKPQTPVLTSALNKAKGVQIKWKAVKKAAGYYVYRKIADGKWEIIGEPKNNSFTDTTAVSGTTYYYTVRSFKEIKGNQYRSWYDEDGISVDYLEAPIINFIKVTDGAIKIKWPVSETSTGYNVYRKELNNGDWVLLTETTKTQYTDTTVKAGKVYVYTVRAFNEITKSGYDSSTAEGIIFKTPGLKKATAVSDGIKVTWKAVTGATAYNVYRKTSKTSWKKIAKVSDTSYVDSTGKAGTTYSYTVRAVRETKLRTFLSSYDTKGVSAKFENTVMKLARERLSALGNKLSAAYYWCVSIPYASDQQGYDSQSWATWTFNTARGDCTGKASAFTYMARALGYEAHTVYGYVPLISGAMGPHGWTEIYYKGAWYICDPDFEYETHYNGWMISYGQSGTWRYSSYSRID